MNITGGDVVGVPATFLAADAVGVSDLPSGVVIKPLSKAGCKEIR